MRKRLLPATTRPIDVRKTRSLSSAEVAKKKEVKNKSNVPRNPKGSNMTAKAKVVKKAPLKSHKIAKPKKKVEVKKVKEVKKKYAKKNQVQPKKESSESDNGESSSSSKEPVEVVIHVKKPQQKAQPKKTKKSGVSSGKIGKRKVKQEEGPGKTLLKNISGSAEKLETVVSTILEVAVLTKKVKPKVQAKTTKKTPVKKKPEKKAIKKEPVSDQSEPSEDQTSKKEVKKKAGKVKKEMKEEKNEIKEEKDVKEEKAKKDTKKEEDKKKDNKPKKSVETKKENESNKNDVAVAGCSKQASKKKNEKPSKATKSKNDKKSEEKLVKDEGKSPKGKKTQKMSPKAKTSEKDKKSSDVKSEESDDEDEKTRRMKLFGFWEGPRRHREASLNALAKVHCLYENESKVMEILDKRPRIEKKKSDKASVKVEPSDSGDENSGTESKATRRTLRTAPGMRSVGRHYDVETSSSSSPSSDESDHEKKAKKKPPQTPRALPAIKDKPEKSEEEKEKKKKEEPARKVRKRRKRCELMMDLKDMVVRKRMASLNASAMLAATYSMEKRSIRSDEDPRRNGRSSDDSTSTDMDVESSDDEVIVSGSSKKVAVIVNQDTDVTITGLYTTRSTRHCSITGMQYRISSTSHTQTESTAVTTETVIHTTDHQSGSSVEAVGSPGAGCKSYTPLGALSSMQPPGNTSPLMRRHPCSTSAFSAPYHPHQEIHGYYQPAGPLISHHHHHSSASTSSSVPTVSGVSPSKASPGLEPPRVEGSAEEYRPPPGFPAAYPPPYSYQYIQPPPYHQDCYSTSYYHKYPNYRRYWPTPPGPPSTQMVASETYPPQGGPLVEPFPPHPPPPPPHHSAYGVYAYSAPPPPPCYSHSPTSRGLAFIDPSFQCPCPMQSCPKNVHTGPLTGASKGSGQTAQAQNQQGNQQNVCLDSQEVSAPLPPVALTLPLETTSAHLGPPSPARGSAGMPPPASPALSTARNPQSWSPPTAHPVPIKEEDMAPKMLPTPPPEQTIVDLPMTDCLQRRPHPTKRKSIDVETEVAIKKRRPATPILHELQPPRQTNCQSDDDDIKPPVLEKQVDLHEKILDLKVVPQEKLMENKDNFLEKPLLIEQIVDQKTIPKTEKPAKKEKVEKKVLTDKKNIQAKVEKKTKKKPMPKINLQKPVNGLKVKKEQPKTKNCREGKKACKKTNIVIKKEIEESPLVRTPTLKWSNGWSWEGEPFKAKVFLTSDEPVMRTCYPAMRHVEGDVICPRDCILLKSGTKKQQLPFVAKVTAMWENPEDGEMIVSLLWYYRPEHTEQGRLPLQPEDEIFASRHKDINSVACIEDKCYVLSYYEYCRYKMNMKMIESGITEDVRSVVPDLVGGYPRESRLPKGQISKDLLFFCRRVYDFRQKRLLKNP